METGARARPALQGSAMFPAMVLKSGVRFAPLERAEIFSAHAFYKRYVPTGRGNSS